MTPVAIRAFNPGPMTGAGNWTWLLRGRVTTLIDAGTGEAKHLDAIAAALAGGRLDQVIVTHGHGDHASGVMALAESFPGARFFKIAWPGRDEKWPVQWLPLTDGARIDAGDDVLTVVHTPGHAPDHVCLWHEQTRDLFCADLAMDGGSIYIPSAHRGGDLAAYLASLERVLALRPARLLPAHGPVIDAPDAVLRAYVAHRLDRERQVLAAIQEGLTTVEAVLPRLYPDVKPGIVPFARDTVLAHLEKLEHDARVRRDGDGWIGLRDRDAAKPA